MSSIPTIVRSYKSEVTKQIREAVKQLGDRIWQRGYYERVLRSGGEFDGASCYILENPLNWDLDDENPLMKHPSP